MDILLTLVLKIYGVDKMEKIENLVVGTRMPIKDVVLLKEVCQARGENISSFIRRSIYRELASLSYLTEKQKKALGVPTHSELNKKET